MNVLTVANSRLYVREILPQFFFKDMPAAFKRRKILSSAYGTPMWPMGYEVQLTVQKGEEEKEEPPRVSGEEEEEEEAAPSSRGMPGRKVFRE